MRDRLNQAIKDAMKSGDKRRLGTLRLILAAIKDRDLGIGGGADAAAGPLGEAEILGLLQKMVKQRRDSAETYKSGGRNDLVEQELAEIKVIEEFLPKQLSDSEVSAAVDATIAETNASGLKDMGRIMATLKQKYTGQMDFGKASTLVKNRLK